MRYKVIDYSVNSDVRLDFGVVDTKQAGLKQVCECFSLADAEKIAAALERDDVD